MAETKTVDSGGCDSEPEPNIGPVVGAPAEAPRLPEAVVPVEDQNLPGLANGDALARIEIPRSGVDDIVVAGVETDDLKRGPGHFPDTPLPGKLGNSAIAGHHALAPVTRRLRWPRMVVSSGASLFDAIARSTSSRTTFSRSRRSAEARPQDWCVHTRRVRRARMR
ncbi:MAG: sortase [Ilumatobacter sp.]|nr:sortase [Ilumatobacter sp.]